MITGREYDPVVKLKGGSKRLCETDRAKLQGR